MFLELGKVLSFFLCILSLCDVMMNAFFIPGVRWQDRLIVTVGRIVFAACICFASGIFFTLTGKTHGRAEQSVASTLPMQMFFWTMVGVALLFALSWYLDAYYVPLLWKNQP